MSAEDEENMEYSMSFMKSMHKNNLEKDLNSDLREKKLTQDQVNYYLAAAIKLNDRGLIKLLEAKAKRLNEQPKMTYRAPSNGPPAIRRRSRRSASRSRSRSPVRRQQHSGPVPRLNLSSSPSRTSGGKTFKRKHKHKRKHTKRR
jgi:hypothetical protein